MYIPKIPSVQFFGTKMLIHTENSIRLFLVAEKWIGEIVDVEISFWNAVGVPGY